MKRKDISGRLGTFAADLVAALGSEIGEHVDALLERALDAAIASVKADVARAPAAPTPSPLDILPPPKPAAAPRAAVPGKVTCSKCGTPGHNARSCKLVEDEPQVRRLTAKHEVVAARRDEIAKRASGLPTPTASFEIGKG